MIHRSQNQIQSENKTYLKLTRAASDGIHDNAGGGAMVKKKRTGLTVDAFAVDLVNLLSLGMIDMSLFYSNKSKFELIGYADSV